LKSVNENQREAAIGMAYQSRNPTIHGSTNQSPTRPRRMAMIDLPDREGAVRYSTAPSVIVADASRELTRVLLEDGRQLLL
jgi:hypothetical protein